MPHMEMFAISVIPFFGMLGTGLWIWMLVHCWRNARLQGNRTWWLLIIFFTHWIGAVAYFLVYVVPRPWWDHLFKVPTQPSQQPTSYYQPPRPQPVPRQTEASYVQPYQSYEQGYHAQSAQYPPYPYPSYPPVPSASSAMPQEEQSYSSADYEQPQTMYPELPPQQQ